MLTAFLLLGILGMLIGALLAFSSIKFHVDINPKIEELENILPGVNCGACGKAGCSGYASAIVNENAPIDLCAPGGPEVAKKLALAMGQEHTEEKEKKVAFVFCQGGKAAADKFIYAGIKKCSAAIMVSGGQKSCTFGCLGFGDCVEACKFDAIKLNANQIPVIDPDKCVNCKACIKVCPKNIIKEVLLKETANVICNSGDPGKIARQKCSAACIACGICVKNCPYQAITIINNLAVIDREKCTNCGICISKCPTKAIA